MQQFRLQNIGNPTKVGTSNQSMCGMAKTNFSKAKMAVNRIKTSDQRNQILLGLKLRPHVRIRDLAKNENARTEDRKKIDQTAECLIQDGETVMIEPGSQNVLSARENNPLGTHCCAVTDSIPGAVSTGLGRREIFLCPGSYLSAESAENGTETNKFSSNFYYDHTIMGASGSTDEEVPSETVNSLATAKLAIFRRASESPLIAGSHKFGRRGIACVDVLEDPSPTLVDCEPATAIRAASDDANVHVVAS